MNKNSINVKNSVENLRNYAKIRGMRLVFRNTPTDAGDFCFFIYKPGRSGYLVGYDGSWDVPVENNCSFENCWKSAHKFISNYKG